MALILTAWFSAVLLTVMHPVYICVTEIQHNAQDRTLEITCKVFADDLEVVLAQRNGSSVRLAAPGDKAALDTLIAGYFADHLSFRVDGREVGYAYLGFEIEHDVAYCYLQVDEIPSVHVLEAFNSMLHDRSERQINIMHVIAGGTRKSTKLDYPATEATFQF